MIRFSALNIAVGLLAGLMTGFSKTAVPGAGLLTVPLFAAITSGRLIPGLTLPTLIAGDVLAVAWYHAHARWDLLRPLAWGVAAGFAAGAAFFVAVGSSTRVLDVAIGLTLLVVVGAQTARLLRRRPPQPATRVSGAVYGSAGGFTTFVSNAAGPIVNTYLLGLGLDRRQLVGTSAWFYFSVNLAKVPLYVAIGAWTSGGRFFTADSLRFDALLVPAVVVGAVVGRRVLHRLPERLFTWAVLVLSGAGAVRLLFS